MADAEPRRRPSPDDRLERPSGDRPTRGSRSRSPRRPRDDDRRDRKRDRDQDRDQDRDGGRYRDRSRGGDRDHDRPRHKKGGGGFKGFKVKEKRADDEDVEESADRRDRGDRSPRRDYRGDRDRYEDRDRDRDRDRGRDRRRDRDWDHDRDRDQNRERDRDRGGDRGRRDRDGGRDRGRDRDRDRKRDKDDKAAAPKKKAAAAVPMANQEFMIVHVNDRLGTKAAIPCLGSDLIRQFKVMVAARIGRDPSEIMLRRQGERPFKDQLSLDDYGISNGVQLDLELDTGD